MTTKSRRKPASKPASSGAQQPAKSKEPSKPSFVSRYIGIDSHLTERNGSTKQVYGIAAERPAGRKLADDIARVCVQLDAEGYDVISIFPLTSGRTAKATVETNHPVHGRTYSRQEPIPEEQSASNGGFRLASYPRYENKHYVDTGVGYSVTEGVIITARLRQ